MGRALGSGKDVRVWDRGKKVFLGSEESVKVNDLGRVLGLGSWCRVLLGSEKGVGFGIWGMGVVGIWGG